MTDPNYLCIPRPSDPIEAATRYFGSRQLLATAIGYTPQAVSNWRSRGSVPAHAARAIELATQGECPASSFFKLGDCG